MRFDDDSDDDDALLLLFTSVFYSDFYENDACGGVHGGEKHGKSVKSG